MVSKCLFLFLISEFVIRICAWADKGHSYPNYNTIETNTRIVLMKVVFSVFIHAPTVYLSGTQVEVFFSRGKQKLFVKHIHHFGSDYFKMQRWEVSIVSKIGGYFGVMRSRAIYELAYCDNKPLQRYYLRMSR